LFSQPTLSAFCYYGHMSKSPKDAKESPYRVGATLPQRYDVNPPRQTRAARGQQSPQQVPQEEEKPKAGLKTWLKRILITLLIVLGVGLIVGGMYASAAWNRVNNTFEGSFFDMLQLRPLEKDSYGRTNIVMFGNSEDDPDHGGAELADSIMVVSIDQKTHQGNMISIPRDLWVEYGSDCSLGSQGKINAAYVCALEATNDDARAASELFAKQVAEVIGTDVQYYVKINYTVIREVVTQLGGIDVTIDSTDPRGIYDAATKIQLSNGVHHLDGEQALQLSRSRGAFGGYGFGTSNFDRERNQQAVVRAMLDKATSTGTLANPWKVLGMVEAIGNNLVTNIHASELLRGLNTARSVDTAALATISFDRSEPRLVTTGMYRGVSIVRPAAGVFDYSDIHAAISTAFQATTPAQ